MMSVFQQRFQRSNGLSFFGGLFIALSLLAGGCGPSSPPAATKELKLSLLCPGSPETSDPRGVSFVFKAEGESGEPITTIGDGNIAIKDGGQFTRAESATAAVSKPQHIVMQSLVLLDGSESLTGLDEKIKKAAAQYITTYFEETGTVKVSKQAAIYKFYGADKIIQISPFTDDQAQAIDALENDTLVQDGTSTALHEAIVSGIDTLEKAPAVDPDSLPAAIIKTLVLFTDGRDEVNAGDRYETTKQLAIDRAKAFYGANGDRIDNIVLVVGVRKSTVSVDESLLRAVASPGGFQAVDNFDSLLDVFQSFSKKSTAEANKYYQLNICSNRRRSRVNATLTISLPGYKPASLPFAYDATNFVDGECSVDSLQTCDWSLAAGCEFGVCYCGKDRVSCDGKACTTLETDPSNCGSCGNRCQPKNGSGGCKDGECTISKCNNGFGDCDDDPTNGCETDLSADPLNCGACGAACETVSDRTSLCSNAQCTFGPCPSKSTRDCDSDGSCETDITSDVNNCGACSHPCGGINGAQACVKSSCSISSCNAGFDDCDGSPATGCEVNLSSNRANCGKCGLACLPGNDCTNGECACAKPTIACPGAPAGSCFGATLDCSTLTNCAGTWSACKTGEKPYCNKTSIICCPADYPYGCPESAIGTCWSAPTACSTITTCGTEHHSCGSTSQHVDCATKKCVAN